MSAYLVTGAAGGIGAATVERLVADGHAVIATDRADAVVDLAASVGVTAIVADLRDPAACLSVVEQAVAVHGSLDGAALCAGVNGTFGDEGWSAGEFDRVVNINARGPMIVAVAVARHIAARNAPGSIVMISSGAAHVAIGLPAPYGASKSSVEAVCRELAFEFAQRGIRVNAIAPGLIDTPMAAPAKADPALLDMLLSHTPMRRMGKPEEVAAAIAFLLGGESSYITATTLRVDGGHLSV
jgi:3-oxoacyl-[acyl-carrier protein] reductase